MFNWDQYFKVYDRFLKQSQTYQKLVRHVLQECSGADPGTIHILDAGCGPGELSERLIREGYLVLSIDRSQKAIEWLVEKQSEARVQRVDLDCLLPFRDNAFDRIICINVLYTLSNPDKTIEEFARVIKKGGRIIAADPKKGFSNLAIYFSDIILAVKKLGIFLGVYYAVKRLPLYLELLYYNLIIDKHSREGNFTFFSAPGYRKIFSKSFQIRKLEMQYANQDIFLVGEKER